MHKQMANYRGVKLNKATCQQMTAEIMQTSFAQNATRVGEKDGCFRRLSLVSLHDRILTLVECTDLTVFSPYSRPQSRFSHTDLVRLVNRSRVMTYTAPPE